MLDDINKEIFKVLKEHIEKKGFELEEISESSVRGIIRDDFYIHLYYDNEYILNIQLEGYRYVTFFFDFNEDGLIKVRDRYFKTKELDDEPNIFKNILEVIDHINNNIDLKI